MGATVSMQGNLTKRCCQVCGVAGVRFVKINNAVHAHNQPCRRRTAVNGFPPAGAPTFASPHTRIRGGWYFPADYSACVQPISSASLAAYCSTSSARAEFLQRVRRLLTGGSLRPACALGGNRLASLFQDCFHCAQICQFAVDCGCLR